MTKRNCFYSFHYLPDNWRAATVRNIGAIEGNKPTSDNNWETVKKGGDAAIKKWISDEMSGTTKIQMADDAGELSIQFSVTGGEVAVAGICGQATLGGRHDCRQRL